MSVENPIAFSEIAAVTRTTNSNDKTMKLNACIDYELKKLMQKINEYNKGGKLVITLDIGVGEKNEMDIKAEVKTTAPKGKQPSNLFFRDEKGELYLDDPRQLHLIDPQVVRMETKDKGVRDNA